MSQQLHFRPELPIDHTPHLSKESQRVKIEEDDMSFAEREYFKQFEKLMRRQVDARSRLHSPDRTTPLTHS